jgi:hypothetical protein
LAVTTLNKPPEFFLKGESMPHIENLTQEIADRVQRLAAEFKSVALPLNEDVHYSAEIQEKETKWTAEAAKIYKSNI